MFSRLFGRVSAARLSLTQLEDRTVPTVTSTFSGGLLAITSNAAADTIEVFRANNVGSNYYYVADGTASAAFSGVTAIDVKGGGGNDLIDVSGVATPVTYDPNKTQATASTSYNQLYDPVYAFNGAGLSSNGNHTNAGVDGYFGNAGWLSTAQTNVDGQYIQEYLGDAVQVSKLVIWNYNQFYAGQSYANRGVQTADIQTSINGITWTTAVAGVTLTKAPGTSTYNTPDTIYLPGAPTADYVRILAHSNFGADSYGNFVGLSEVKVFGDPSTATVMGPRLSPASTAASTTYPGVGAVSAGNGSGLNPVNHAYYDTTWQHTWLSTNQANVAGQYIQFDLGVVTKLDRVRIWNYNQFFDGLSYGNRGIQNGQIQFSTNGISWTTVVSTAFPEAPGSSLYSGFDVNLTGLGSTRFVRIVAQSNYGSDSFGNFVGLSQVMFFPSVPAPVPSLGVTVHGNSGNDTIVGGTGPDTLIGGAGNDVFVMVPNSTNTQDTIVHFTQGQDKLNLAAYGVTSLTSLYAHGGSTAHVGGDTVIYLPPVYGTKTVKLAGFTGTLTDSDFVP